MNPASSPAVTKATAPDGMTVAYRSLTGVGHPIVAIHGFTGNGLTMLPLIEASREGRPAILVDVIGHGESGAPDHLEHYTMASVVDQVLSVIGPHEPGTVHLLGYSMGARIALSMAARAPWYFASLTLLSGTAGLGHAGDRARRHVEDHKLADRLLEVGLEEFVEDWLRLPIFAPFVQTLSVDELAATKAQRQGASPIGLANSLRGTGTGSMPPLWSVLASVRSPLLAIAGSLDAKYTDLAHAMAEAVATGRAEIVAGAGHVVHHENLPEVASIVQSFLSECETDEDHEG